LSFYSNLYASVCESYWEDCDDSIFSEICDTVDESKKVNVIEEVQNNEVDNDCTTNAENMTKRKYCATESNGQLVGERKNTMMKKLKTNSLFKF